MNRLFCAGALALLLAACGPPPPRPGAPPPPAAAVAAPVKVDAPTGAYTLDKTHASLTWRVNHMGLSQYTARFTRFDAQLSFDATDPSKSTLTATVDPTSVETDYPGADKDFDKELLEPNFFNAKTFPAITFTSTAIALTGANAATVTGDLEMLGVKKPVTLQVTFNGSKNPHPFAQVPALGFSAIGVVKRSEFGMTHLIGGVGDEVEVLIQAEFLQTTPAIQ